MQYVTSTFKDIFNDITHITLARITFGTAPNTDVYNIDNLYDDINLKGNLYPNNVPGVGAANAKQLSFTILPKSIIPRGEKLLLEVAVQNDTDTSEWIPQGTFYVDTRETCSDGIRTTFHCYDTMLKADMPYIANSGITEWTQSTTDVNVVLDIITILGISVTLNTMSILGGYIVQRPLDDYTIRDVLGYIAAMNGGNFIITPSNALDLIKFVPDRALLASEEEIKVKFGNTFIVLHTPGSNTVGENEANVYRNVETFTDLGVFPAYTGVKGWYDDDHNYTAGDESGSVLEFDCPWVTQAAVNAIFGEIAGYVYHAFEATKAELIPAAEIGDVVGVNGVYAPLGSIDVSITGAYLPDIAAPSNGEMDYEYPYQSTIEKEIKRRTAEALTAVEQIANGTYQGGTFIDGTNIYSPNIYGGATLHVGANPQVQGGYNFVVDSSGNVTSHGSASFDGNLNLGGNIGMTGNIVLDQYGSINLSQGSITWGANNSPVVAKYSVNGTVASGMTPATDPNWHDTLALTDYYAAYSYDGGITWTDPVRIRGTNGSDANVTFNNINSALGSLFRKYSQGDPTSVSDYELYSPNIYAGQLYACVIHAGTGDYGYADIEGHAFNMYDAGGNNKIGLGYMATVPSGAEQDPTQWTTYPLLRLGAGTGSSSSGAGIMMKFGRGVWIGDSSVSIAPGDYPGDVNSVTDISNYYPNATGLFIDLLGDTIYKYIEGVPTQISGAVAVFG